MKTLAALLLAFLGFTSAIDVKTYKNYKVYNVQPAENQNVFLKDFQDNINFDFWSPLNKVGDPVYIMTTPAAQPGFEEYLQGNNIPFSVHIEDVQSTVEAEKNYHKARKPLASGRISWDQYLQYDEIISYLTELAQTNSDILTIETIGQSYENRSIYLVRISTSSATKPQIYVEGGIHAREWISPAVVTYLITQLVDPANRDLIEDINWLIIPSLNPDGYQYTWDRERLWRKTRVPGNICDGVDGNRNFDFHWMETGASNWECSETYAGPKSFSEVETQALRDSILQEQNVKLFLSIHSYGNYLLYSWGWTSELPHDAEELHALAQNVDDAIASVNGTRYRIGSTSNLLYAVAGGSRDWAKGVADIALTYTIELPGGGTNGFDLPASSIYPVSVETFEGFRAYGEYILNKFGK